VFHTFFENTFSARDFQAADLERIYQAEARFLENAEGVFFESRWGMEKAREAYGLQGDHYYVVSRGGLLEPPAEDSWAAGPLRLLSIAMNFEQKGGDIILRVFRELKARYPDLHWHVIGGPPTGDWRSVGGIVHEGVLDPTDPADLQRYRSLLAGAFVLLHPTREDSNPLVITEAGYFGCPAISVNRFALPELIVDGETGILLDYPAQPADLAAALGHLIESPTDYRAMRRAAFEHARRCGDWERIGRQMADSIATALA
jgi:glycosyltransferase involved in cell wall biosynthesis